MAVPVALSHADSRSLTFSQPDLSVTMTRYSLANNGAVDADSTHATSNDAVISSEAQTGGHAAIYSHRPQASRGTKDTLSRLPDLLSLTWVALGCVASGTQTPGTRDELVGEQYDHLPNASRADSLTIEQRLERVEKALAQKLNLDSAAEGRETEPASESIVSANDPPLNLPAVGDLTWEERITRLEGQFARVFGDGGHDSQNTGSGSNHGFEDYDDSADGLGLRRYNSHDRAEFMKDEMARAPDSILFTYGVAMDAESELAMRGVLRDMGYPKKPAVTLRNGDRYFPPGLLDKDTEGQLRDLYRHHAEEELREKIRARMERNRETAGHGVSNGGVQGGASSSDDVSGVGRTELKPGEECALM